MPVRFKRKCDIDKVIDLFFYLLLLFSVDFFSVASFFTSFFSDVCFLTLFSDLLVLLSER